MEPSPLDRPELRAIERHIDCGELDQAQRLLATLKPYRSNQRASAYLVTRILFERGNLDAHEAAIRLRSLLAFGAAFPEAVRLLERVEVAMKASLDANGRTTKQDTEPASPKAVRRAARHSSASSQTSRLETERTSGPPSDSFSSVFPVSSVRIPKAPGLPSFGSALDRASAGVRKAPSSGDSQEAPTYFEPLTGRKPIPHSSVLNPSDSVATRKNTRPKKEPLPRLGLGRGRK